MPSTTWTPRSGVTTSEVVPSAAPNVPEAAADSRARTTVVPTAMTLPPADLAARTAAAVCGVTWNHSG